MKLYFLFLLTFLLFSCSTVNFNEPQSFGGQRITEFPDELRGSWSKETDTIRITSTALVEITTQYDSLSNTVKQKKRLTPLDDSLLLFKQDRFYIFNDLNPSGFYQIYLLKQDQQGNIHHYFCDDPSVYNNFKGLQIDSASVIVSEYYEPSGEMVEYDSTLISPTATELKNKTFSQINKVCYSGQIQYKYLKKLCKKEYLIMTLQSDGTIFIPENELFGDE